MEHLCAQAGFAPRVAYELDDLPAAQAFVAAGIAVVPMHGLTLATLPPGATARPLAERPRRQPHDRGARPAAARTPVADDLLERLGGRRARLCATRVERYRARIINDSRR